jgi:hypothetical protein
MRIAFRTYMVALMLAVVLVAGVAVALSTGSGEDHNKGPLHLSSSSVEDLDRRVTALEGLMVTREARDRLVDERLERIASERHSSSPSSGSGTHVQASPGAPAAQDPPTEAIDEILSSDAMKSRLEVAFAAMQAKDREARAKALEESRASAEKAIVDDLASQLGLSDYQKSVLSDAMGTARAKVSEVIARAMEGGDMAAMQDARRQASEARAEADEKIKVALSTDQYEKYKELTSMGATPGAPPPGMGAGPGRRQR